MTKTINLVLVGGGHAHIQVLRSLPLTLLRSRFGFCIRPVLISDTCHAVYSGMLPAALAGLYSESKISVDLKKLTESVGWEFIQGRVKEIRGGDRLVKWVCGDDDVTSGEIRFDVCSVDVGSETRGIDGGGGEHVVHTRPIGKLLGRVRKFEGKAREGKRRIVVIGGGAAGVELTFALKARWCERTEMEIVLVESGVLLGGQDDLAKVVKKRMERKGVTVHEEWRARRVRVEGSKKIVEFENGERLPFDLLVVAAGAKACQWLKDNTDLETSTEGYLLVKPTLQSVGNDYVFAAGDCTSFGDFYGEGFPPKAGVYAVRQGPILTHNILTVLTTLTGNSGVLTPLFFKEYVPQQSFLSLIMTGDGNAIGSKYGLVLQGRWVWRLKNYIDSRWMKSFHELYPTNTLQKRNCRIERYGEEKEEEERSSKLMASIFRGSAAEGAAILLAADTLSESFEKQVAVLRRMDEDDEFCSEVKRTSFRPEHLESKAMVFRPEITV